MRKILMLLTLICFGQAAGAAEVTVIPGGNLYLNPTNPAKNYRDLVLHSVLISTGPGETFEVSAVQIELLSHGHVMLSKSFPLERLVGETQGLGQMVAQGMGVFLNAQILSRDGFKGLFGRDLEFAGSATLGPNQVLMLTRQHFSLDFAPDTLRVTVSGAGRTVTANVPVVERASPISYDAPLRGTWLMTSLPSIQSHHRLNPPTEFAVDFFKTDAEGRINDGDKMDAGTYYGYGANVLAAADGEVVFVIADEVQDRAAYMPKEGESPRQTGARISRYNMRRYATDFARAAAGNIIVIKHQAGDIAEFSSYGHLKAASVAVAVGDRVTRGQIIAGVGDTGDSAAVHLHFQINAGADVFMSQGLPVVFADLDANMQGVDPGRFVRKAE